MAATQNKLLGGLAPEHRSRLAPYLERVELGCGEVLVRAHQAISHVHFVESGLLSIVSDQSGRERVELAMIGREGVSGLPVVTGRAISAFRTVVQLPGSAFRMSSGAFHRACRESVAVHDLILAYAQVLSTQMAENGRAGARAAVGVRLARWLLMVHDRAGGDDLPFTHEVISTALGVRRPGVTVAIHILEGEHIIRATRGRIRIVDRAGLISAAKGFYGLPEAEFESLVRRPPATLAA